MNKIINQIKEVFSTKEISKTNQLRYLAEQLLEEIRSIKDKYNAYTSINENIVNEILTRFCVYNEIRFYSLKDAFFKKGFVCSACSPILRDYYPDLDSKVASIMDVHYILTGITNCDEFCCGSYGVNSLLWTSKVT